jgi:hypothetical protein
MTPILFSVFNPHFSFLYTDRQVYYKNSTKSYQLQAILTFLTQYALFSFYGLFYMKPGDDPCIDLNTSLKSLKWNRRCV